MAGTWKVEVIATQVVQDGNPETPGIDVDYGLAVVGGVAASGCYADCNGDGVLTVADFGCFQTKFVAADPYADCNGDGSRTVADFGCFQTKFVAADPYADCNGDGQLSVADFGCFQTKYVIGCP